MIKHPKKIFPNPGPRYVLRKTYLSKLKRKNIEIDNLSKDKKQISVCIENYYSTHNRKFRCDCGHCIYARRLLNLPTYRETLADLLREKEIAEKWFEQ